jgi:hypothetical protein
MALSKPKTFADCYIYSLTDKSGYNSNRALIQFIHDANRIDKSSPAFKGVRDQLKSRVNSAVIYRMLEQDNVVLAIHEKKELPASLKIFYAYDILSANKTPKVFVDCTGLFEIKNGYVVCKDLEKLSSYLLGVLITELYYTDNNKLIMNPKVQQYSISAFMRMFCSMLDYFRIPTYMSNKEKIRYISGVYFAYNVMRLDINAAKSAVTSIGGFSKADANSYDYYYSYEDDFKNIDTFITYLASTFKLDGINTGVIVDKWMRMYGKGTLYSLELYPSFAQMLAYCYSDATYINNSKRIQSVVSKDLVDLSSLIIRLGSESFDKGFKFESAIDRDRLQLISDMEKSKQELGEDKAKTSDIFKEKVLKEA